MAGLPHNIFWDILSPDSSLMSLRFAHWTVFFGPFWPIFVPKWVILGPEGQFQPFCNWPTKYTAPLSPKKSMLFQAGTPCLQNPQHWPPGEEGGKICRIIFPKLPIFKSSFVIWRGVKKINRSMRENLFLWAYGVATLRASRLNAKYSWKTSEHTSARLFRRTKPFAVSK